MTVGDGEGLDVGLGDNDRLGVRPGVEVADFFWSSCQKRSICGSGTRRESAFAARNNRMRE